MNSTITLQDTEVGIPLKSPRLRCYEFDHLRARHCSMNSIICVQCISLWTWSFVHNTQRYELDPFVIYSSTASQRHNNKDGRNDKDARRKTHAGRKTREGFFNNILPLTLLKGFERVVQGLHVRGSWRSNINCNILTPLLWSSRCVFLIL